MRPDVIDVKTVANGPGTVVRAAARAMGHFQP